MRLSYKWLKKITPFNEPVEKLAELLTLHVAQVEKIEKLSDRLNKVIVAEIINIKPHPNADKLRVVELKAIVKGRQLKVTVVCGAPNIKVGQKVPLALPGAKLVGGAEINESVIRGIKSDGMLCAEDELGIDTDHTGIYVLPKETKIGESLNKILGFDDTILEIENKSITHRSDLFSHLGFAREIAAIKERQLKIKSVKNLKTAEKLPLKVKVEDNNLCPHYIGVVMDNIIIGPSPIWMQNLLRNLGIRPINNVVDITNYVLLELGQPLHAFDYSKLESNGEKTIIVRNAKKGEKLLALDGKEYVLENGDIVIADKSKPIALAGIMGGELSGISEQTKTIVIESAAFDPLTIRRTSRRLGIRTEASLRFEKGIAFRSQKIALDRAIELISEICGGRVASESVDIFAGWSWIQHIGLRKTYIKNFLDADIPEQKTIEIIKALGFEIEKFDIVREAKKHLGKPYVYGAKFKTHGTTAFDCSYLTDYIYSLIDKFIGHTSLAQIHLGKPVKKNDLRPGDVLFLKGVIDKSAVGYYFVPDGQGNHLKVKTNKYPKGVGHCALYIGNGKIIHATHYDYDFQKKKWLKRNEKGGKVAEESVDKFLKHPEYLGARRYVDNLDDYFALTVPWWRPDVKIEEDVIEEILRIYGTNKIIPQPIIGELKPIAYEKEFITERELKNILVGCGFDEVYNYSFYWGGVLDQKQEIELLNPVSQEQKNLRVGLLSLLLINAQKNLPNFDNFKIFETGRVFQDYPSENVEKKQRKMIAGLVIDNKNDGLNLFLKIKGIVQLILDDTNINRDRVQYMSMVDFKNKTTKDWLWAWPYFNELASQVILLDNKIIGLFGEIDHSEAQSLKITSPLAMFELDLEFLANEYPAAKKFIEIPVFPPVKRDLSFLIDLPYTYQTIETELKKLMRAWTNIVNFELIDEFRDKKFGEKRSLAFRFTLQENRTFTAEMINETIEKIIRLMKNKFGAELRTL